MSAYAALIRLYPRSFREDYGPDMEVLLRRQLQDEPALRVWGRALLDVVLTVPPQHLEVLMSRPVSSSSLYSGLGIVSLAAAGLLVATVGLSPVGLAVVVVLVALGAISWRRSHALSGSGGNRGWTFLLAGVVGLAVTVLSVQGRDELASGPWTVFAIALVASVVLLVAGLWQVIAQTGARRPT
jgi:uncharacterized membrane protein YhaH (DUF805 family)